MKKVLFIIQSYPSEKSANVLCDEQVMKALIETGNFEIHCLCYKYGDQVDSEIIDGIHVHRWNRGLWWRIYSKAEYREMKCKHIIRTINRIMMRIKQILFIPIFPFYEPGLSLKNAKNAEKLFIKEKFDIVIAEHNGLDTLFSGWRLKKKYEVTYIPVFWDSLSGGFRPKYLPSNFVDKKKEKLERKILQDCNAAIMMESHRNHILKVYSSEKQLVRKINFLDIPYLKFISNKEEEMFDRKFINIVFAGNMSMRNPTYFFKVVQKSSIKNIMVHFFTKEKEHFKIKKIAEQYNVSVTCYDYVTHDQLEKYLDSADILLNFGVNNPNAISGKIFEYIGYMKPIISTFFIDEESVIPVLKKYPCSLLIDERKEVEIYRKAIEELLDKRKSVIIEKKDIEKLFKNNMADSYVEIIEKIGRREENKYGI